MNKLRFPTPYTTPDVQVRFGPTTINQRPVSHGQRNGLVDACACASVPFSTDHDRIVFKASVNGLLATVLLDSAASHGFISAQFARTSGIGTFKEESAVAPLGNVQVQMTQEVVVEIGPIRSNLSLASIDLQKFEEFIGLKIDVVIGINFFRDYILEISFSSKMISLWRHSSRLPSGYSALSLSIIDGLPFIEARIEERRVRSLIDIGMNGDLNLTTSLWQSLRLNVPTSDAVVSDSSGTLVIVDRLRLPRVHIGDHQVSDLDVRIIAPYTSLITADADAMVGLALMEQFDLFIDYRGRQLLVKPRESPPHRTVDRSGITLGLEDGKLTVIHVSKNSPAEADGWLSGEKIAEINGESFTHFSSKTMSWATQEPGCVVEFVMDDGSHREITLRDYY